MKILGKKFIKKIFRVLLVIAFAFCCIWISGCSNKADSQKQVEKSESITNDVVKNDEKSGNGDTLSIKDVPIHKETKFHGVRVEKSIAEFNSLGFEYGDSIDIIFSNGYELKDIPYYNGYYNKFGEPLLVAYQGNDYVEVCLNNSDGLWEIGNFKLGDTANIILNERGKYKKNQDLMDVRYTDNRDDYSSDEVFANFRNVKVGNLKDNILYRGASPIDNHRKRAKYANDLIKSVGIKYDIDLSDDENDLKKHFEVSDFSSDYFKSLYDSGKVCLSSMAMNFKSKEYADKVIKALTDISKNEGPYYIHCVEGKDRTGFVLAVVEGLVGASYEEIVKDYMKTYENYCGINEINNKEKYDAIKANFIDDMLRFLADSDPIGGTKDLELSEIDWVNVMGRYITNNGMSEEDIDNLYNNLTTGVFSDPD